MELALTEPNFRFWIKLKTILENEEKQPGSGGTKIWEKGATRSDFPFFPVFIL